MRRARDAAAAAEEPPNFNFVVDAANAFNNVRDVDAEIQRALEAADDLENEASKEEVLLLVDAANGFNNLSRYGMLWTVRHRCAKLSRFAFNCYRHEIRLVCRRPGMEALILLSK